MRIAAAVVLMGACAWLMGDAWSDIAHIAERDPEASQVYLAPIVALWLFWVRRVRLRRLPITGAWAGPAMLAGAWLLYVMGDRLLLQSMWHLGAVAGVVACLVTVCGWQAFARFLPAYGALCFLVPIPGRIRQAIAVPLQAATAQVTEAVLETFGVAVERAGSVLTVNGQEVLIAEACNGLRMVFALAIVSYAFAYGVPLRNGIRALVVLVSPLTAILFNVLRLVPVVWGFGQLAPDVAQSLHDLSAWVMLPVSFAALLGMMRVLKWAQVPIAPHILASSGG